MNKVILFIGLLFVITQVLAQDNLGGYNQYPYEHTQLELIQLALTQSTLAQTEPSTKTKSAKTELTQKNQNKNNVYKTRLSSFKPKSWYKKVNYFVTLGQEQRHIDISRQPENEVMKLELFKANYDATLLSFTAGGNVFRRTSMHLDVSLNKFTLKGNIHGIDTEPVKYQRNKSLAELFVEHDLSNRFINGFTLGFDLYYGRDRYRNLGNITTYTDQEYGGGLMVSRKLKFETSDLRFDYIFSYRKAEVDGVEPDQSLNRFHNVLLGYRYQWSYDFSTGFNGRLSYYPNVNKANYWESDFIYSLTSEVNYRLSDSNELSLRMEYMSFGSSDYTHIISLRFEHLFGSKQSKRRRRRYKIPNLLIK